MILAIWPQNSCTCRQISVSVSLCVYLKLEGIVGSILCSEDVRDRDFDRSYYVHVSSRYVYG
jgi:hypothetical protein